MRRLFVLLPLLASPFVQAEPVKLESESARMGYGVGYDLGVNFKRKGVNADPSTLMRGMQDALSDTPSALSEEEMGKARTELRRMNQTAQQVQMEKAADAKRAAGRSFMEANAKKAGVVSLPSGLQYRVIQAGEGAKPGSGDTVTVHYKGTRIDGSEFDSSYRRNQPAIFPLNGVIAGWTEGLQLMQPGGKHELFIPPELAYGKRGRLADETLVFEVELLSVAPVKKAD